METKNIILELRTKKGVVSGRVSTKGYGYTAGSVTLGKWGDGSQYGDFKVIVKGV